MSSARGVEFLESASWLLDRIWACLPRNISSGACIQGAIVCNYGTRPVACMFLVQPVKLLSVERGKRGLEDPLMASMHDAVSSPNLGYHQRASRPE